LYIQQGNFEQANSLIDQAFSINLQQPLLAEVYADIAYFQGDLELAQMRYSKASAHPDASRYARASIMAALLANTEDEAGLTLRIDALIISLKEAHRLGNDKYQLSLLLAQLYSYKQQYNTAFRYLIQATEQGYQLDFHVLNAPIFNELRTLPRFQQMLTQQQQLKRVQVAEYFKVNID
jgi:hypothetical protein